MCLSAAAFARQLRTLDCSSAARLLAGNGDHGPLQDCDESLGAVLLCVDFGGDDAEALAAFDHAARSDEAVAACGGEQVDFDFRRDDFHIQRDEREGGVASRAVADGEGEACVAEALLLARVRQDGCGDAHEAFANF